MLPRNLIPTLVNSELLVYQGELSAEAGKLIQAGKLVEAKDWLHAAELLRCNASECEAELARQTTENRERRKLVSDEVAKRGL